MLSNKHYRLVLDSQGANVTFNNANRSDITFHSVELKDLMVYEDFDSYDFYNIRLLQVKLGKASGTLNNDEMNFEMRLSLINMLGQVENKDYLNELTLHQFTIPYGQPNMTASQTVNNIDNNNVFTIRKQDSTDIRLRYISFDKTNNIIRSVPDTNTGTQYGHVQLILEIEPVKCL